MAHLTCARCGQQFDGESLQAGQSNHCSACRYPNHVPSALDRAAGELAVTVPTETPTLPPSNLARESATLPPAVEAEVTLPPKAVADSPVPQSGLTFVPGYEIQGELGRGGMGVVYKARQTGLNRTVALKMILSGGHAGVDELSRFRTEAEVVARLQHPNVVQIYDVGEQNGLPYFSLEFCGGGSLADRLAKGPLPAPEAAEMVAILARGVHAAHQRGIIHRDLKPANVLLAADGTPKISDFGLAKRLGEAGQTQSGAILGTPSYMAPEQAGGSAVTTLADVYALGAILYECLSGQPPFKAASAMDTLLQVIDQDRPAPAPGVEASLDLICLTALAKEPATRYQSALTLAEDLDRWLRDEPVSVRPPSLAVLLRGWVRQNFGAAGWTVMVGFSCGVILAVAMWLSVIQSSVAPLAAAYERLPNAHRPLLAWSWRPPEWLRYTSGLLALLAQCALGLLTALLVRPRHRQADIAAGLVTGTVASVVLFTFCFGWAAVLAKNSRVMTDVWLISRADWTDERPDGGRPDHRLMEKYPDLREVPADMRRLICYRKLACDQMVNIPVGLWLGMLLSAGFCLVPAVTGTVAAGARLRQGGSLTRVLLAYLELALPGVVLVANVGVLIFFLVFSEQRLTMPVWYILVTVCLSLLSCVAVMRRWPWVVRLALHAGWLSATILAPLFESGTGG